MVFIFPHKHTVSLKPARDSEKSRDDDFDVILIFLQNTMAETPAAESSIREPTHDEVRTLSQRMGFVIREEEISVYQGIN